MTDGEELAKDLGLISALTIGIGTMIGAGIFVLPGVAAQRAGPVIVLSFALGGFIALFNALSVSELGTAMPKAGGAYYFINRSLGPMFGSISGLGDWLGLAFASAFYVIGFGQYLGQILELPSILFLNSIQVGAVLAGIAFVGVNYIGAKETGGVQTVIVGALLAILTVFTIVGWFSFDWATITAGEGLTQETIAPFGMGELLPATGLVFVSYLGYAKIATVAEEMKNPGRNLPIAIVGSVVFVTIVYTILVTLMIGIVPWPDLDLEAPVAHAAELAFPAGIAGAAAVFMTLAALLATASSANASILASARINFAMGRDEIITDWLNQIHPRFATPSRSIIVTGAMILGFVVFLGRDIALLAEAASVLHLIVFALLNLAVIVFRETNHPGYDPEFRVPLYPIVPILGATLSLGLIAFMEFWPQVIAVLFVVGAVAWYLVYARRRTPIQGSLGEYIRDRPERMPDIAVSAAKAAAPDSSVPYRVMVPVANPETEDELIALGSTLANHRNGVVHAVHIIEVPDQTSLDYVAEQADEIAPDASERLASARETAAEYGAEIETQTVVSHRAFVQVFDSAERLDADAVVMGWSPRRPWTTGRTGGAIEELTLNLPCDFLVFKDRGFDPSRVLLPTAGGPDSDLSAEMAKALRDIHGARITVLHVIDDEMDHARAMGFVAGWAEEHGLGDADLQVRTHGDIQGAIKDAAADHTLVLMGATGRGLLSRLLGDSLVYAVVDEIECSVLLTERPARRSLRERLIGRPSGERHREPPIDDQPTTGN